MRDGKIHRRFKSRSDATHDKIVAMMVGRALTDSISGSAGYRAGFERDQPVLGRGKSWWSPALPQGVSFAARRGEILGFAGLGRCRSNGTDAGALRCGCAALGGTMLLEWQTV